MLRALLAAAVYGGLGLPVPSACGDASHSSALPRYRLKVGQELSYSQKYEFHFKYGKDDAPGTHLDKTKWQIWVIRQNADTSWRIVLHSSRKSSAIYGKDEGKEGPPTVALAYCDVFPDGRFTPNSSLGYNLNPQTLFPRLPSDSQAAAKGWEAFHERDAVRSRFREVAQARSDSSWVFDEVRESPLDAIYLLSSRSRHHFDWKRGLVQRAENDYAQGYGFNGKGATITKLEGVKERDAAWLKKLAAETEVYFAAAETYRDLMDRAEKEIQNTGELLAKAEVTLKEVSGKLTLPLFRQQIDDQLKTHARRAKWIAEDAKGRAEVIGKPAAPWNTEDLDGNAHSLKDFRGKVIILDFWYRGCSWCIRAMPQVCQLAEDFKHEPVVVLGMNTDRELKNARFFVDKMKLTYRVLKAQGLPKKYGVQGFPTLIVVDQAGNVHEMHLGYSPTLREDVARTVKALLGKKQ
jgi:thiol-disulfide isomerase/thioredoxin